MIERATAARRAALDSLFVGDQHVSATPYYQNTPMLGRLFAEWGKAPAGCLFLLPLWHPVLMAEQIGTLAAIAQGRLIMQCGLGWGEARFAAMGAHIRTRPSAFEEALDIVRRLLAGETVSSSRRFRIAEASLALRPAEPVAVWIASPGLASEERARRPTCIASAAPLTAGSPAPSSCGVTSMSASRHPRHRRYCSRR